jgi:hypothetical protein
VSVLASASVCQFSSVQPSIHVLHLLHHHF